MDLFDAETLKDYLTAKDESIDFIKFSQIHIESLVHLSSGFYLQKQLAWLWRLLPPKPGLGKFATPFLGADIVNIWTKLDLDVKHARGNYPVKNYYPNYGYDLDKALAKYPITDLNDPGKKANLINSVKKGDLGSAELMLNGKKATVFIAANPEMKSLDIYFKKMHPVRDYHILPKVKSEKEMVGPLLESGSLEKKSKGKVNSGAIDPDKLVKPWQSESSETKDRSVGR